jgi:hypothetical protein
MTFTITILLAVVDTQKEEIKVFKKENLKLKENQKPATNLYNENNKPCAGC